MSRDALRISKNQIEIMSVLEAAIDLPGAFLWQSLDDNRSYFDFTLKSVDSVHRKMSLLFHDAQTRINPKESCFIKIPVKGGAFKVNLLEFTEQIAIFDIPVEIVLNENRVENRIQFREEDSKEGVFQCDQEGEPMFSFKEQKFKVVNVSRHGISLLASAAQSEKINSNDRWLALALGDHPLPEPLRGQLIYKSLLQNSASSRSKDLQMKLGIRFSKPIPAEIFESFTYPAKKVALNHPYFKKDPTYSDAIHRSSENVLKQIFQKKKLEALFKKLEIKREEYHYLKNHIELLCEVVCYIGREVGWVSTNNLDKLVYVVHMHDIGYFEHPHLARISDPREMEFKKQFYSPAERKVFLDGPGLAADFAREEDLSSSDAYKILMQQKERPDGNGFPHGIESSQLTALSCLFIACHDFVDYVIEDSEWKSQDFVERAKKTYSGPHFNKIIHAFESLA